MLSHLWAMERIKNKLFAKVLPLFLITQQSRVSWKSTLDCEQALRAQPKMRGVGKGIKAGGSPSPSIALPPSPAPFACLLLRSQAFSSSCFPGNQKPFNRLRPRDLLLSQVEPSQHLNPANFTSDLTANDLNKAAQISNTILEAVSQDSSLSTEEKTKVIVFKK